VERKETRILARHLARELTAEEISLVSGGGGHEHDGTCNHYTTVGCRESFDDSSVKIP
jgi:hypothetical protein